MPEKVNYNPDILSCLANLSSDEVFTPPEIANAMLDMLPQELFRSPDTKFLDPGCKSGVFLREIAKRLNEGLKDRIPDVEQRMDHIMKNQLFAIAITQITGLLSRRSVYCSKDASGRFSVARFDNTDGNIRYKRVEHKWVDGRCSVCGASKDVQDRGAELESHAYEFIHMDKTTEKELIDMKFDVIIGNPPYQLEDGGAQASARPIYHLFIEQAKKLNPRYLSMIVPARWYSGGKGLDSFRDEMLHDDRIGIIHDYPDVNDVFPGLQIKAGVMYFLWSRDHVGNCDITTHLNGKIVGPINRPLLESGCDTFIRYNEAISVIEKIKNHHEASFMPLVSARMPFGLPNTFKGKKQKDSGDIALFISGNDREYRGSKVFVNPSQITKNPGWINAHKVFIGYAGSGSDSFPHSILTKPFYGEPGTACTETYLVIGPFVSKEVCLNVMSYIATKFFRFLVLQRKPTQHVTRSVHGFVPMQDFSKPWTDEELYQKYGLTEDEIAFIESMIKPMDLGGSDA